MKVERGRDWKPVNVRRAYWMIRRSGVVGAVLGDAGVWYNRGRLVYDVFGSPKLFARRQSVVAQAT